MAKTKSGERAIKLEALKRLTIACDRLRDELGVSEHGEVVFRADLSDEELIVAADGFGGAELAIIEGNYPVDYMTKHSKNFSDEAKALEKANCIMDYTYGNTPKGVTLRKTYKDWTDLCDAIFEKGK